MHDGVVDLVGLTGELKTHTWDFCLVPRLWSACSVEALSWEEVPLTRDNRGDVPAMPGVYTLVVCSNVARHPRCSYIFYVGRSNDLQRRFSEYLSEARNPRRPKVHVVLNLYEDHVRFCFATLEESLVGATEEALLTALLPPCNSEFTGEIGQARRAF